MLGFICPLLTNSRFILNWLTELAQIMIFFSFFWFVVKNIQSVSRYNPQNEATK